MRESGVADFPGKPNAYTNPDDYINWLKSTQGMTQQEAATTLRWQAQADKMEMDAQAQKKTEQSKTTGGSTGVQNIPQPVIPATTSVTGDISTAGYGVPEVDTTEDTLPADTATTNTVVKVSPERQSIIDILTSRFAQFGLESLASKIKDLAIDGATEATVTFALQNTEEYKQRFKANEDRLKKNLSVLSPSEYIALEDTYRQVLRAYGLNQFDNDAYVSRFISNDVSPTELSNRVVTATQRIQNADPAVSKTLSDYYGIGQQDLVAYVLDPEQQYPKIQRQIAAAEIGTAARVQGLEAGVGTAEQLAAQGVTQAEAQKGYATIAELLPTTQKLSEIYGSSMEQYGQKQAEQEVFNSLASAQRARQKLSQREIATFSGSSGLSSAALKKQTSGQI